MTINIQILDKVAPISGKGKDLKIIDCGNPDFSILWNQFLENYPIYTYRHELRVFNYYKLVAGNALKDCSFLLVGRNDLPLVICPLFTFKTHTGQKIGAMGESHYPPILLCHPNFSSKQRRAAENFAFEESIRRLKVEDVQRWQVEADILSVGTELIENQIFARKGALDVSIHQHIVDLRVDELDLRYQIRRRANTEINGGLKKYEFLIFDQDTFTDDIGKRHRLLHHKTAGRVTRPIESFELSYEWIKQGKAFFVEQRFNGETVNMTLVQMSKGTAIGVSTADDPDFKPKVPLMHSMMWKIMLECKNRGIDFLEIGETNFRETMYQILTSKEKNIIYFKRGFGTHSWPQKRWVWFRDKKAELDYLKAKLSQYENYLEMSEECS